MNEPASRKSFLKVLGPGLLFAGTSVGVSEMVQSTRAGADFSFALLIVIVLACALKYPAFAFGPWYAHATGVSLLEGFRRQGRWALILFLLVTLGTVFTVQAIVTLISASVLASLLGLDYQFSVLGLNLGPAVTVSAGLLIACALILRAGEYKWLDRVNKTLIFVLTASTIVATILALTKLSTGTMVWTLPEGTLSDRGPIVRVTGLIGWTPAAYDVAVWHSVWFLAHRAQSGQNPTLKEARLDFNIGYWFSSFTSVCFLTLGACLMYANGFVFPENPVAFASALVNLYVLNFGEWARPLLGLCAFSAMFSTVLVVTDSFPRVLSNLVQRFREPEQPQLTPVMPKRLYWFAMAAICTLALAILAHGLGQPPLGGGIKLGQLIDLATTLSFLSAPFLGFLIHRAMFSKDIPTEMRPGRFLQSFSMFSIAFNVVFGAYFLWLRFWS